MADSESSHVPLVLRLANILRLQKESELESNLNEKVNLVNNGVTPSVSVSATSTTALPFVDELHLIGGQHQRTHLPEVKRVRVELLSNTGCSEQWSWVLATVVSLCLLTLLVVTLIVFRETLCKSLRRLKQKVTKATKECEWGFRGCQMEEVLERSCMKCPVSLSPSSVEEADNNGIRMSANVAREYEDISQAVQWGHVPRRITEAEDETTGPIRSEICRTITTESVRQPRLSVRRPPSL